MVLLFFLLLILLQFVQPNKCLATNNEKPSLSSGKQKWAIVALTKPGRTDILKRNDNLAKVLRPFASKHQIDVIFFSEIPFPDQTKLKYQQPFKDIAQVKFVDTFSNGFDLNERFGYKYMCKFFAFDIYQYLKEYDYYMRCDSDCYISRLQYDLFDWVHTNHVEYSFAIRKLEAHGPTKNLLPTWVDNYLTKCSISASSPMDRPLSVCFNFYNNWHIGKVSFFLRSDVQHFLQSVNSSNHILTHRWGDSSIQAYAVRVFMEEGRIRQVPNFTYVHGSHGMEVKTEERWGRRGGGIGGGERGGMVLSQHTDVPQTLPPWT